MGTFCRINLFENGTPELYDNIFARLYELEDIFSAAREGSDLDMVNENAGLEPVKVRQELIEVTEKALYYSAISNGLFDPSVGPLVKLWGIGTDRERVPAEEEILAALNLIDYREIEINREDQTIFLKRPGMALELGAIAKGYAADEIVKLLAREGIERAIIDLGGNIFAMGERSSGRSPAKSLAGRIGDFFNNLIPGRKESSGRDDSYWRVAIQDPRDSLGSYLGIVNVKNKTVVTSGIYERFFEKEGKQYHHILSVESGYPVDNGLISVTIIADNSMDADALSTAAFALGWEQGRGLITSAPGTMGIFVFDDLSIRIAGDPEYFFTLTAMEYRLQ